MQTFKEVLQRDQERKNLQNVGLCVLAVVLLTVGAFLMAHLKPGADLSGWADEAVVGLER